MFTLDRLSQLIPLLIKLYMEEMSVLKVPKNLHLCRYCIYYYTNIQTFKWQRTLRNNVPNFCDIKWCC